MKTIDVKNQPTLSLGRTIQISVNGIRYRLFRSIVTVVVIAVAMAFLMNVLCESISFRAVGEQAKIHTAEQRLAARWTARLSVAATPDTVLREVAEVPADDPIMREAQAMLKSATPDYQPHARQAVAYLTFFADAGYARRRLLVGHATDTAIFDALQTPDAWQNFTTALSKQKSLHLPTTPDAFQTFLRDWPRLKAATEQIVAGRQTAIAKIDATLHGTDMLEALTEADGAFGDVVRHAGFTAFGPAIAATVAQQARGAQLARLMEESCQQPDLRKQVRAHLDITTGDVQTAMLWAMLTHADDAAWYLGAIKDTLKTGYAAKLQELRLSDTGVTAASIVQLARTNDARSNWERALHLTADAGGNRARMAWLVLISLLVCVVGISNAMLMSVTERFREIATLKCLGSLDGFIMTLFLLEAGLLGAVGGVGGALIGSVIGFGRMGASFGGMLISAFPLTDWLLSMLAAVGAGVLLAALAGVYPAYMAARLAPMEAMRIE